MKKKILDPSASKILAFSGPSGAGKGTLISKIFEIFAPKLELCVSATTRKPRITERDGKDYYFISKKNFENGIENGEYIEYTQFDNNYYGKKNFQLLKYIIYLN